MKKNYLCLISVFLLSCSHIDKSSQNSSESISDSSTTIIETATNSETSSFSEETSSFQSSFSESIVFSDDIIEEKSIDIINNTFLNINSYISSLYDDVWIEIEIEDKEIASADLNLNIYGKKEGKTMAKVYASDKYDEVTLNVTGQYLNALMVKDKKITILGTSISDVTLQASVYQGKKDHKYWVDLLNEKYEPANIYNHAMYGSTLSYSKALEGTRYECFVNHISDSNIVNDIKKSDVIFIEYGANDFWRKVSMGEVGDVNETNISKKESFKGAYSYLLDKIREYNPNILIVTFTIIPSNWNFDGGYDNQNPYFNSRDEMSSFIKEISESKGAACIDMSNLWDFNDPKALSTYCLDGIHPSTIGYQLMLDRIFNNN